MTGAHSTWALRTCAAPSLTVAQAAPVSVIVRPSITDMSWAHKSDPEWLAWVSENAGGNRCLVFGRVTYQQMASYWPTPAALQAAPAVAKGMNQMPKVVFSRTLAQATWQNTRLLRGDLVEAVHKLKAEGPDMVVLGSGSLVTQLARAGLVDEYQLVLHPVALGAGRTLFEGSPARLDLKLTKTRSFANGCVVLWYAP